MTNESKEKDLGRRGRLRRNEKKLFSGKDTGIGKHVDENALKKFREKPYQLQYAENQRMKAECNEHGQADEPSNAKRR